MLRRTLALAFLALPMAAACEDPVPVAPAPDQAPPDLPVGNDDDDDDGEPVPPAADARRPSVTSGGGSAASDAHHVQLSVGAPVPRGDAASTDSRLHMDP